MVTGHVLVGGSCENPVLSFFQVSLTSLELLKAIAVDGGASSLQSADLQLSGSSSLMSSLEEMMDLF